LWIPGIALAALVMAALACTLLTGGQGETDETASQATPTTESPDEAAAPEEPEESEEGQPAEEEPAESESSGNAVRARANEDINVRELPGPGCPIIGSVPRDEEINLLVRTMSTSEYWYQTDYLGPEEPGWVYHGPLTLLEDDSDLPRVPDAGCLYCGDGICSPEIGEECDVCVPDCGVCPFCGDGVVNQDWEECDGGGCGDRYECSANCACERLPVVCGDGIVEGDEECDPPNPPDVIPCDTTVTYCNESCQTIVGTAGCEPGPADPFCGDGICNEDACSCEADCGPC
jgi:hypothetical protein